MYLLNDIYTINKIKIYNKEEQINTNLIKKIKRLGKYTKTKFKKIEDTFLLNDFKLAFEDSNYEIIFQPKQISSKITEIIKNSVLEKNVISELENIKNNFGYTYHHILKVTALTIRMVLYFRKGNYNPILATHAGLTHDLGKSRVPKQVLYKTEKLSLKEWELIQTHPTISYLLLLYYPVKYKKECLATSFQHHEKFDGSGYPRGIRKVSKYTKLITPNDMLDALLSSRPYRKTPYTLRAALDCLQEEAEQGKIDKTVVYYLISLARKDKPDIKDMLVGRKWREAPPKDNFYGIRG